MGNARHVHGPVTTAKDGRFADGGLLAVQGPTAIDARTGVLYGPGSTALVTGTAATAPMTVAIAPHHWVATRGAANGPYLGALEAATTATIPAAPAAGAGTRIDVVYVKQQDSQAGIPSPDGTNAPLYGVVSGVAGGAKPALPVGAEELATVSVSPGATATNGANVVIANTARQTVPRGASIPVRNQAERDALTTHPFLTVKRLDTGRIEMRNLADNAWVVIYEPAPAAAPGCELTGTGTQAIASAGWANLLWATELQDPRNMHSTATNTNRVVVPETRWYTVSGTAYWGGSAVGRRGIRVVVNDDAAGAATIRELLSPAVTNTRSAISAGAYLTAGTYVGIQVYQDSGAALDVTLSNSHMAVIPGPLN